MRSMLTRLTESYWKIASEREEVDFSAQWNLEWSEDDWIRVTFKDPAHVYRYFRTVDQPDFEALISELEQILEERAQVWALNVGSALFLRFPRNNVFCEIQSNYVSLTSPNIAPIRKVSDANLMPEPTRNQTVHLLQATNRGVELIPGGEINYPLQEENYEPETVEKIRKVIEWADSESPYGRIVMFAGPFGTGKSHAVRAIITETQNVEWVFVPSGCVSILSRPDAVRVMIRERDGRGPLGLVIEDADALMRERVHNDENVVSQILNLGDGLLGDIANIRMILTTNCDRLQIEPALLRPGRLNSFVQFDKLSTQRATELFKHLSGGSEHKFADPVALTEVYRAVYEHDTGVAAPSQNGFGQYV